MGRKQKKPTDRTKIYGLPGCSINKPEKLLLDLIRISWNINKDSKYLNDKKDLIKNEINKLYDKDYEKINFGKDFGIWKNDNFDLSTKAEKILNNFDDEEVIQKYFDIVILNMLIKTPKIDHSNSEFYQLSNKTFNPLMILLEYLSSEKYLKKIKENSADTFNSNDVYDSFTEYGFDPNWLTERKQKRGKNEITNQFIHLLKNTSYFQLEKKKKEINLLTLKIKTDIEKLKLKCNTKYHNKNYEYYENIFDSKSKVCLYLKTEILSNQKIYYGAPGTGKSYKLKEESENYFYPENIKIITFHPSYSYSNFVGSYKPKTEGDKTVFDFVPGPLINILIKAYEKPEENHLLIIEEINRANVSEVFGDFFQLIERDKDGISQYDINVSEDLKDYLEKNKKGLLNPDELRFPENLYINATMNSSDQGTFPLDTAFKRRWDFEYIGIDDNEEKVEKIYFKLPGDDKKVKWNWNSFRKSINEILLEINTTINEDKLLGPFFIGGNLNSNDLKENAEIIKNKVIPYLYEDVLKFLGPEAMKEIFNLDPKNKEYSNKTLSEIIQKFDEEKFENIFSEKLKSLYQKYEKEREDKNQDNKKS